MKGRPTYFGDYLVYQAGAAFPGGRNLLENLRGSDAEARAKVQNTYMGLMSSRESARRFTIAGYNASISPGAPTGEAVRLLPIRAVVGLGRRLGLDLWWLLEHQFGVVTGTKQAR